MLGVDAMPSTDTWAVGPTLTTSVVPCWRSRTKISGSEFVSAATYSPDGEKFSDRNTTNPPFAEIMEKNMLAVDSPHPSGTFARNVLGAHAGTATPFARQRSRTKMSLASLASSPGASRFEASLANATKRPSPETVWFHERPSVSPPSYATLTRSIVGVQP